MIIYSDIEDKQEAILSQAEHMRKAAAAVNCLKPVLRAFNGKVYNCRFDEAIAQISTENERYYVYNSYGWLYIAWNNSRTMHSQSINLLSAYSCKGSAEYEKHHTRPECIVFDGKRILAEKMIERLNTKREELLRDAYELEEAARNLDGILKQIDDTHRLLNRLVEALPAPVKDICGLKRYY